MSIPQDLMLKLDAFTVSIHEELRNEQVSHPVSEYTPERVEKLYAQMVQANRFQHPDSLSFNV